MDRLTHPPEQRPARQPRIALSCSRAATTGSATFEALVVAPILVVLLLAGIALGRLLLVRQQLVEAARDGVAAGVVWPTAAEAAGASRAAALDALHAARLRCTTVHIAVGTSNFRPGGSLRVTLRCTLSLGAMLPALPGSIDLEANATLAVEPYRVIA